MACTTKTYEPWTFIFGCRSIVDLCCTWPGDLELSEDLDVWMNEQHQSWCGICCGSYGQLAAHIANVRSSLDTHTIFIGKPITQRRLGRPRSSWVLHCYQAIGGPHGFCIWTLVGQTGLDARNILGTPSLQILAD